MDYAKESLRLHGDWKGKIEVVATVPAQMRMICLLHITGVASFPHFAVPCPHKRH